MNATLARIGLPALLLVVSAFFAAYLLMPPPPPKKVLVATGRTDGVYYTVAKAYQAALQKEGITLQIVPTAGSEAALSALRKGEVDFAFIQGGTPAHGASGLYGIAALYFEPLWIMHRVGSEFATLSELEGARIAIGMPGSGTNALSRALLSANGIDGNRSRLLPLPLAEAIDALVDGRIDVLMSVVSAKSPLVAQALHREKIALFDSRRAPAYAKRFLYLSEVTLPEGVLDLAEDIPPRDIRMVATTAQLVTGKEASHEIIRLLLRKAKQIHSAPTLFAPAGTFPTPDYLQFPLHEEARRYFEHGDTWLERTFPFPIATLIDRLMIFLIPILTLLLPLLKGFFPIYRWRIRHQIYRWYRLLRQIDEKAETLDTEGIERELERIGRLQREVQEHVNVPLSYMGEYYLLREHIRLIKEKLINLLQHRRHETI